MVVLLFHDVSMPSSSYFKFQRIKFYELCWTTGESYVTDTTSVTLNLNEPKEIVQNGKFQLNVTHRHLQQKHSNKYDISVENGKSPHFHVNQF